MTDPRLNPAVRASEGTIVFTDLAGFTEFTALRGDEAAVELLTLQEQIVRRQVRRKGRIVKSLGDGLMLWFDDPCDAVRSSLVIQVAFQDAYSSDPDFAFWMRAGVHFGKPVVRGRDLVGNDVNVAARIAEMAAPGEVLISESTRDRIGSLLPNVLFEEVGPAIMKGIPDPVYLFRAVPVD